MKHDLDPIRSILITAEDPQVNHRHIGRVMDDFESFAIASFLYEKRRMGCHGRGGGMQIRMGVAYGVLSAVHLPFRHALVWYEVRQRRQP